MNDGSEEEGEEPLPPNRFELELEFVQALASPAYLHFLATTASTSSNGGGLLLQDPDFIAFLKYLRSYWEKPEYAKYLIFPHCLYFLNLLIDQPAVIKEWTLPAFRNFCHQQQFLAWQHRHANLYGVGSSSKKKAAADDERKPEEKKPTDTEEKMIY